MDLSDLSPASDYSACQATELWLKVWYEPASVTG